MENNRANSKQAAKSGLILLTGATGYVGRRLLAALAADGRPVRCMVRDADRFKKGLPRSIEVVGGDVFDEPSLAAALDGAHTAFYLVHSMGRKGSFEDHDRRAAENFGRAARRAGVAHIVYLGGLASGDDLSSHLQSRLEVGRILAASGVPTTEFRASIIVGAGSLSFEMIRALVDRLPVMITPRWVSTLAQPIAIDDVVAYLVAAVDANEADRAIYEIGGADRASYLEIMKHYARRRGLRRLMIPVPFLTPWLSSLWLGLVTPLFARVGRKLIEGVRNETIVRDGRALEVFPIRPRSLSDAIAGALRKE